MIDLSKITYRVVVVSESGNQYNIKNYIENLGWEENENEIAVRSSFTVRNDPTSKGYLSNIIKPGCLIGIFASDRGGMDEEVARGYVESWNPVQESSGTTLKCTCYDELYKLQKSQDNLYFPSGTGTQAALIGIFDDWEIPTEDEYKGPNATHGRLKYNNQYLSDTIRDLLDDAAKKGEEKCVLRAAKGKTSVLPKGSNKTVYVFKADNTKVVSESMSTANLVTRVKVIGQADDAGNSSIEAMLNGLTQYGIRQRIYVRGSDESLSDATSAAQEILGEKGNIVKEISVQSPDVPFIRKGDLVYLMAGTSEGYFFVKGIRHDIDTYSMTMDLETTDQAGGGASSGGSSGSSGAGKSYEVGDTVNYHGGTHYLSSYPDAKGYGARAGKAKITIKNGAGKAHPWHLVHVDSGSNVYGWVDDDSFD